MNKKTVLITGSCGYVGSLLVKKILSRIDLNHWNIIGIDSGMFGFEGSKHIECDRYKLYRTKLCDSLKYEIHNTPDKIDAVIHLSGLSNDPLADFDKNANMSLNYEDTKRIYQYAIDQGIPRFIYASSASVYGMSEDSLVFESSPTNAVSNYALSKLMSEQYIRKSVESNANLETRPVILRKGTICGWSPRMRYDLVINTMIMSAMKNKEIILNGGGENWRPICDINFVTDTYINLINMPDIKYMCLSNHVTYNLVQENFRVSELGLRIQEIMNRHYSLGVKLKPDYEKPRDIRSYRMSGCNIINAMEIKKVDLNLLDMVTKIVSWTLNNKVDFNDPIYYNISWIKQCQRVSEHLGYPYQLG